MSPLVSHKSPPCHLPGIEAPGPGPHSGDMLLAAAAFVLTIRVYDVYGLPPADRQVMLSVASTALAEAGVEAAWIDCSGRTPAAACQLSVAPTEVVLRIHRLPPDDSHALGVAIVNDRGPDTIATVYATHVADMARRAGVSTTLLLGHVAAHEIGHLLLGTNRHAPNGLMRASWSWMQIQRAHAEDWRFDAADIASIQDRLAARQAQAELAEPGPAPAPMETTRIATTVMSSIRPFAPARSSSAGGTSER